MFISFYTAFDSPVYSLTLLTFPKSLAGCAVMQRVLDTAVPRFLQQLKQDYALWAAGDEDRKPVADGELI